MSISQELSQAGLTSRICLLVFLENASDQFKLRRYGDIVYFSKKMRYCVIYVDQAEAEKIKTEISHLNFVKRVEISASDQVDLSSTHIEQQIAEMAKEAEAKLEQQNEDPYN